MKLIRWGEAGAEQAGLMDDSGTLRDLSGTVADWSWQTLTSETLAQVAALDPNTLPALPADTRLGAPVSRPGKIVGCALTYGKHAAKAGLEPPEEPMFMLTAASAINGPNDQVMMPKGGTKLDWEAELAVVFCRAGANTPLENSMSHVAGFCVSNDLSERVFQLERGTQWTKGKSADTLKPLGPWLVTTEEVGDPNQLDISLHVNGEVRQQSNTSDMMHSIAELVSIISRYTSWQPRDVMMTGTPPDVGYGMKPPQYLNIGDVMEVRIDKLGTQRKTVVAYGPRYA